MTEVLFYSGILISILFSKSEEIICVNLGKSLR